MSAQWGQSLFPVNIVLEVLALYSLEKQIDDSTCTDEGIPRSSAFPGGDRFIKNAASLHRALFTVVLFIDQKSRVSRHAPICAIIAGSEIMRPCRPDQVGPEAGVFMSQRASPPYAAVSYRCIQWQCARYLR